jgi:hypothetical protein
VTAHPTPRRAGRLDSGLSIAATVGIPGEMCLLAAVLRTAIDDARAGDADAAAWLAGDGAAWLSLLGVHHMTDNERDALLSEATAFIRRELPRLIVAAGPDAGWSFPLHGRGRSLKSEVKIVSTVCDGTPSAPTPTPGRARRT